MNRNRGSGRNMGSGIGMYMGIAGSLAVVEV